MIQDTPQTIPDPPQVRNPKITNKGSCNTFPYHMHGTSHIVINPKLFTNHANCPNPCHSLPNSMEKLNHQANWSIHGQFNWTFPKLIKNTPRRPSPCNPISMHNLFFTFRLPKTLTPTTNRLFFFLYDYRS